MILKQSKSTLYYIEEQKISEYELLLKYNPLIINRKIKSIEMQIEESYHLNVSHMTCDDVDGVITVSYPLEKLVIWIIQQREDLERFKNNSFNRINLLKQIIHGYTKQEQKEVMDYMRSHGRIKAYETIDKLQRDLYKIKNYNHINSARKDERAAAV